MKNKVLALFFLFGFIFMGQVALADLTILDFVDVSDDARGLDIFGSYIYVADGSAGFQVVDKSVSDNLTIVGSIDTPGYAFGVRVSGSYAYVADRHEGLQVIDIRDPTNPTIVGSIQTPDHAVSVDVSGSYAYVVGYKNGLLIIDVRDPENPTIIGSNSTPVSNSSVYVSGSYAYVSDRLQGLLIIDISDPTNPIMVGSITTPGRAGGIHVLGSYAYVADIDTGFYVIDISNHAAPVIVGFYYMPAAARDILVSEHYAYVVGQDTGLNVIDIQDPTNPIFVSNVGSPPYVPRGIDISGTHAYVADYHAGGSNGIYAIDISEYAPSIVIASPNGEEKLTAGETFEITWTSPGDIELVKIEYSVNSGDNWFEIDSNTENDGYYNWVVPCVSSNNCLVRITGIDSEFSDVSDAVFAISCELQLKYKLHSKCKGGLWNLDVSVNGESIENLNCGKEENIDETITLPPGPGVVVISAVGPGLRQCSSSFLYEQYLDKLKLECNDGSKGDRVEATFEVKRKGHGYDDHN